MEIFNLFKKIRFYKRMIIFCYILAAISVSFSLSITVIYFVKNDTVLFEFVFGLFGTMVFGFGVPYILIQKLNEKLDLLKIEIERKVQMMVVTLLQIYKAAHEPQIENNKIWINIILVFLEQLPLYVHKSWAVFVSDLSKIIAQELNKNPPKKKNHAKRVA